jgi:hypothetical protein
MTTPQRPQVTLHAQRHPRPYMIQWERTLRWRERVAESITHGGGSETFDFLLALFASLFHMRDWIIAIRTDLRSDVSALFMSCNDLALARDIATAPSTWRPLTTRSMARRRRPRIRPRRSVPLRRAPAQWPQPRLSGTRRQMHRRDPGVHGNAGSTVRQAQPGTATSHATEIASALNRTWFAQVGYPLCCPSCGIA